MADLYLIAHCVRGEAAFDVATKMDCPHCTDTTSDICFDCDNLGFWWIIPTSGHRAFPFHYWPWDELACDSKINESVFDPISIQPPAMPSGWPDHFKSLPAPKVDITSLFRAAQPQQPRIARRL